MDESNEEPNAVLVPADYLTKALTSVRSLGSHDVRTVVACPDRKVPAAWSRYCDEAIIVPSPWDDLVGYKDALVTIASRPDVRSIVPTMEEVAFLLATYSAEFEPHVARVWPSFEATRTAQDSLRAAEAAEAIGLPVAETKPFEEVDDWSRDLIVKPRFEILTEEYEPSLAPGEVRRGVEPVYPRAGDEPDRAAVEETFEENPPIVQECIPIANEYSFRALYDDGSVVTTSLKRQIRGHSYAGGSSAFCELTRNPTIERRGTALLDHLDWHGIVTVQFIEDARTGEFLFSEISPRFWTTIPLDVRGGVDYPYYLWLLAQGATDRIEPDARIGYASHHLYGETTYLSSILREEFPNVDKPAFGPALRDTAVSLFEHPSSFFFARDDPHPFVRGLLNALPVGE